MRRLLLLVLLAGVLAVGPAMAADEAQPPAAPKADAAPAAAKPAPDASGGCMPGGACCGDPACAQMAEQHHAMHDTAGGGCPCMKNKSAPQSK